MCFFLDKWCLRLLHIDNIDSQRDIVLVQVVELDGGIKCITLSQSFIKGTKGCFADQVWKTLLWRGSIAYTEVRMDPAT